jgi:hypothetical protein
LEFNGKRCWYCLEADRATMPITRGERRHVPSVHPCSIPCRR